MMKKKVAELTDEEFIARSKELYKHIDVDEELLAMEGWLMGNPNGSTKGVRTRKFITGWLSRGNRLNKPIVTPRTPPAWIPPRQTIHCPVCEATGLMEAVRKGRRYCFRCPECNNSDYNIPKWQDGYKRKGFKLDLKDKGWSTNDTLILKGLIFLGSDSGAWKYAPKDCQDASIELHNAGWRPKLHLMHR